MTKLEIPVKNKEEVIIAEKGGADRLEICIHDEAGGVTPTIEQISEIISYTTLPCYLLIRPSLDTYSLNEEQFLYLLHLVEIAKLSGVKGIVIGMLKDGKVDRERLEKIISIKDNLELVFNHAIDSAFDWDEEINYLIDNPGVDWIQTNGSSLTIFDGYKRLLPILDRLKPKLIIGRRLDNDNITKLLNEGFTDIVFQCKSAFKDQTNGMLQLDKVKEFKNIINKGSDNNE